MKDWQAYLAVALLAWAGNGSDCLAQTPSGWLIHDLDRPQPPRVQPAPQTLPLPPPAGAVVLFDGSNLASWRASDGGPAGWVVRDGYMESVPESGYLHTADGFGDVQLHVEWAAPNPPQGTSQQRGNSGVFLMGKYEIQVLDSFQSNTYPDGQAAAIYGQYPPLANACLPPGEWQAYDIVFRRPRFDQHGKLQTPARLTVVHNGVLVHDARELWGPTSWLKNAPYEPHPDRLPLALQDHGNPVRYRNIWLRELRETPAERPQQAVTRAYRRVSVEHLERLAGNYLLEDEQPLTVLHKEGQIWAQPEGRQRLELIPASETEFLLRSTAGRMVFQLDRDQHPVALKFYLGGRTYEARRAD
jgi:hypothetical protein